MGLSAQQATLAQTCQQQQGACQKAEAKEKAEAEVGGSGGKRKKVEKAKTGKWAILSTLGGRVAQKGERVQGKYEGAEGGVNWFYGYVTSVDVATGCVGIKYDDGDKEEGVQPKFVKVYSCGAEVDAGLAAIEEAKAIENNQKIKQYNNAPAEFPTFVREGYDVKLITSPGFVTQDDGLVYKDFEVGAGPTPEDGQEVTFHYVAYNENGGTIDSTYRKNAPASTRLGINGMIPGFEEGLKGMREGGRRRVVVPPELGPPTGPATFFSAKQWEVFDIELIKIKNCSRVQSSFMSSTVVCE